MSSKIIPLDKAVGLPVPPREIESQTPQREIDRSDIHGTIYKTRFICGLILIIVHILALVELRKCSSIYLEVRIMAGIAGVLCIIIPYVTQLTIFEIYKYFNVKITYNLNIGDLNTKLYTVFMIGLAMCEMFIMVSSIDNTNSCTLIIFIVGGFNLFIIACLICWMLINGCSVILIWLCCPCYAK